MANATQEAPRLAVANPHRTTLHGPQFLDHMVCSRLAETPAIEYLDAEGQTLQITFRHLGILASRLASQIRNLGINGGRRIIVPVVMPQNPALYVSYQAVLSCGFAFCPITPDTPRDRLVFITQDVDARVVLCLPEMLKDLQASLKSLTCIAVNLEDLLHSSELGVGYPDCHRTVSDTAYVMYTSGSTGKPKGVPISHHAVCQSLIAHDEYIPPFKRFLQFASPTFDVSLFEIFFTWFRGSTLVCCGKEKLLADLPGMLNILQIDAAELTPTVATTLLRTRTAAPQLKVLLTIGEMLTPQIIKEFGGDENKRSMLFAMYGPTEAAIHCTVVPTMSTQSSIHNIGRPFPSVTAFILQEVQEGNTTQTPQALLIGQVGELALAGQLAHGYLNRPEQTTQAFIDLPGYGRVYRTGDQACMNPDGSLQILGRIATGQVKLRGQRIELGEIEEAASRTDGLHIAVVLVIKETLVLFCSGDPSLRESDVNDKCNAWLPSYMRPSDIVIIHQGIPRLPSGKVDRKALQQIYATRYPDTDDSSAIALSPAETMLVDTLTAELGLKINAHTPLRSAGLDSLRAIKIASLLKSKFGSINVAKILEADTVFHLARILHDNRNGSGENLGRGANIAQLSGWTTVPKAFGHLRGLPGDAGEVLPCNPMQIAMLAETNQDSRLNFNYINVQLRSSITFSVFKKAFLQVINHNSILRAGFFATDDPDMPFVYKVKNNVSLDGPVSLAHPIQLSEITEAHVAEVVIHHALYDGWSWDLILQDLNTLLAGGQMQERPSFQDFVQAQANEAELHGAADLMAWTTFLRDLEAQNFPVLRSELRIEHSPAQHLGKLSVSPKDLTETACNWNVSRSALIHTSLVLILAELFDSRDVATGLVVAGRDNSMHAVTEVIGPCLSTFPILTSLKNCEILRDTVNDVYRGYLQCLKHPNVSLAEIKSALNMPSTALPFDVVFVWQESLWSPCNATDSVWSIRAYDNLSYALVVEIEPLRESLNIKITYDVIRISAQQAETIFSQINFVTNMLLSAPELPTMNLWDNLPMPLASISLATCESTNTADLTGTISKLAQADPTRVAIEFVRSFDVSTRAFDSCSLTYGQLYHRAQIAARRLVVNLGLVPNDLIMVKSSKSIDLYVLICATAFAGLAYLCVDPNTPDSRMRDIILEAKPKMLVTDQRYQTNQFSIPETRHVLSSEVVTDGLGADQPLKVCTSGSDLAYAVFTSGSTGVPKGVLITRENLLSNVQHLAKIYPSSRSSKMLQTCSIAFDVSVFEIFWTWHCGMTLCSAENDVLFSDIEGLIETLKVSHLSMTPSVAALVDPRKVPCVEFLVCAGEPMSAKVFEMWADRGLHQGYGPSETTNICNVRSYTTIKAPINNVGPAFPNTSLFICRRLPSDHQARPLNLSHFTPLPQGAVGEIWIGGSQVGRGYTDPDLTARSWLVHPEYGRLYRSGDIGRLLADGSLVILGREDDQAKIRGQRIELNEINTTMMQCEFVQDTVSTILSSQGSHSRLVAFWVPFNLEYANISSAVQMLYGHLQEKLPIYMIPDFLVPVPFIPLTTQSKIDKRNLASIFNELSQEELANLSLAGSSNEKEKPMTYEEGLICQALSEVSGIPKQEIKIHASFFTYGVDSIRAIALVQKLRSFGLDYIALSSIMKFSSVKRLAAHYSHNVLRGQVPAQDQVRAALNSVPEDVQNPIRAVCEARQLEIQSILPCTPLQEAMLASGSSKHNSYYNHLTYKLNVSETQVRQAWNTMISRYDLLRTFFALTDHIQQPFVQIVLESYGLPWVGIGEDIPSAPSPFDLPPYQLSIRKPRDAGTELHLLIHHALYDAEAIKILQREIEISCRGESLPPPVPFSLYLDFMVGTTFDEDADFWRRVMSGVQPCRIADHLPKFDNQSQRTVTMKYNRHFTYQDLARCAITTPTTVLAIIQASLARLLAIYLRHSNPCFGTVFSGRNIDVKDVEHVFGPCFNTLPTPAFMGGSTTNTSLCQGFQELNSQMLHHQATSLRRIMKSTNSDGTAFFDVLLLLQTPSPTLDPQIWELVDDEGQMDFPFIFEVLPKPELDHVDIRLHCLDFHDHLFLEVFVSDFAKTIADTIKHPSRPSMNDLGIQSPLLEVPYTNSINGVNDQDSEAASETDTQRGVIVQTVSSAILGLRTRGPEKINLEKNIFQLGLDSISVVQLASRLKMQHFHVTASELLQQPKVRDIVNLCEQRHNQERVDYSKSTYDFTAFESKHRSSVLTTLCHPSSRVQAIYPCTATQIGILAEFVKSQGTLYYNRLCFHISENVEIPLLEKAFTKIVQRHPLLRTSFVQIEDHETPFAMVINNEPSPNQLRFGHGDKTKIRTVKKLTDLKDPPWQVRIFESAGIWKMEVSIMHALYDAQSLQQILNDVIDEYHGKILPTPVSIEPALATILSLNQSNHFSQNFWEIGKKLAQPTKFPDLNILRDVESCFHVAKLTIQHSISAVRTRCEELGWTLSAACQIAWARLLAAYTGQEHVAFGNVLSGRSFEDFTLNDVVLPCINTLPIIIDCSSDNKSMASHIQWYNAQLHNNPHMSPLSFSKVLGVEDLLFDTLFVMQKENQHQGRENLWQLVTEEGTAENVISLEVIPDELSLTFRLTFNGRRVPMEHGEIILGQVETLLYEVLDLDISADRALPAMKARRPPVMPTIPSEYECLHELVLATASRVPDRIALEVVTGLEDDKLAVKRWNFRELVSKASQVANLILAQDVKTGDMVALCFEKCPEASVSILGILLAGCTYVAIDPDAPHARKDYIMRDSGCKIVLTNSAMSASFEGLEQVTSICVSLADLDSNCGKNTVKLSRQVSSDDTCYCLYTSGTTGTPKGCLISHKSAVQAMCSFSRIFHGQWTEESRWLQFAAYHFDVSVLEHFWSWKEGVCVTVVPRDLLFEDLPGMIDRLGVTHLDLTPSLARHLSPQTTPSLCKGVFIVGGEQVRQDIIETWGDTGCLYNFYGPSEVTIGCTVHPRVKRGVKPTNIGRQWDNVGSYVLHSDSQEPVLVGAVGELCLSGVLVGKGYLNRPELTTAKFVDLDATGERVYRTGDLVRMLHDGSFEFLGRIDDQVKLRGQRLEIGEIDHVLLECKGPFEDVATIVAKHPEQEKEQLVAFLSLAQSGPKKNIKPSLLPSASHGDQIANIRKYVADKLPTYMVPIYFLAVDALPLTVNNKVDAKSLKTLFATTSLSDIRQRQASSSASSQVPHDQLDHVAQIVVRYLNVDRNLIEPDTSLFQLGLDSVSVIGLSRVLKAAGFRNASVPLIMKRPIMADLAESILDSFPPSSDEQRLRQNAQAQIQGFASKHKSAVCRALGRAAEDIECIVPCTALQQGMISRLLSSETKEMPYLTKLVYQLDNSVRINQLAEAWKALSSQLAVMRTRFVPTEDGYAQVVFSKPDLAINFDLGEDSVDNDAFPTIHRCFLEWSHSVTELGLNCPWQVWLTERGAGRSKYMSIFIFHALYDGTSMSLLLQNLSSLYVEPARTVVGGPQFHEALCFGPLLHRNGAADFWRRSLKHITLLFPDRQMGMMKPMKSKVVHSETPALPIRQMCMNLAVTPQAVFLSAWLITLNQHFNINPCIGCVVSGRSIDLDNAESIIGPMFNTLPFAVSGLSRGSDFAELVRVCHKMSVETIPHQHTALSNIRKWNQLKTSRALFDSLFVHHGLRERSHAPTKKLWTEVQTDSALDYPLNIEVEEVADKFGITIAFADFVEADQLMRIMKDIVQSGAEGQTMPLPSTLFMTELDSMPEEMASHDNSEPCNEREFTDDEKLIRAELADFSSVEQSAIGLHHPTVFELGLDSVDALKLAARLKNKGIKIPVSGILQQPSVAGLAAACKSQGKDVSSKAHSELQKQISEWKTTAQSLNLSVDNIEAVHPVTPMQEGLLLEYEKYYYVLTFELQDNLDLQRFAHAVHQAIQDTPVLRTGFFMLEEPVNGVTFLQVIKKPQAPSSKAPILRTYKDHGELEEHLQKLKGNAKIESLPQLQMASMGNGKSYLLLSISHALYDGWSLHLILDHIQACYQNQRPPVIGSGKIAEHIFETRKAAFSESAIEFWSETLKEASPSIVHPATTGAPSCLIQSTSKTKPSVMQQTCRSHGITLQSLGLAAWALTVALLTNQLQVSCFGLVVSGRTSETAERMSYPAFNTVIFQVPLNLQWHKRDLLHQAHAFAVKLYEHQHFPLSKALRLAHNDGRELFNTLFTFQKVPHSADKAEALFKPAELGIGNESQPPYALNVELEERGDEMATTLSVQAGMMTESEASSLLDMFDHIIGFLSEPQDTTLFHVKGNRVSTCGLPAIELPRGVSTVTDSSGSVPGQVECDHQQREWSTIEMTIREVFSKVSGVDEADIGRDTSLFSLGLDSVSAIRLSKLLREAGFKVPVSIILKGQSAKKIASSLEEAPASGSVVSSGKATSLNASYLVSHLQLPLVEAGINPDQVEEVIPATGGQIYMLDMWRASDGRLFYSTFWLEVKNCSPSRFEEAFGRLVAQAGILKSRYLEDDGKLYQVVFGPASQQPGAISYRILEDGEGLLVALHIHHALYDAVSLDMMLRQLQQFCQDEEHGEPPNSPLGALAEMTERCRAQAQNFWTQYLEDSYPQRLQNRGSFETERSEVFEPQLLPVAGLKMLGRQESISVQALFFAILARIYAGSRDKDVQMAGAKQGGSTVVLGIYLANRSLDLDGIAEAVAPTFNIVPLEVDTSEDVGVIDAARKVQQHLEQIGRAEHCGVSLRDIHVWTGVQIDCYVNFLKLPDQEMQLGGTVNDNRVSISHAQSHAKERLRRWVTEQGGIRGASPFLGKEPEEAAQWCLPALDVEARIGEDDHLAVGIFAPSDMFEQGELGRVMGRLKDALKQLKPRERQE